MLLLRSAPRPCPFTWLDGDLLIGAIAGPAVCGLREVRGDRFLDAARRLQTETWGEYVFVRREVAGALSIYRDPGGAMEALAWKTGEVSVCASALPPWLDPGLPRNLALDWPVISAMAVNPTLQTAGCGLRGLHALTPGEAWHEGKAHQLWRPRDHIGVRPPRVRTSPAELVAVVRDAVERLADGPVLLEVSGGLDSAIIAGCLPRARFAAAVNYFVRDPQGDERAFARAVAKLARVALTEVEKPAAALDLKALGAASGGPRPALNVFDQAHDADVAGRCEDLGIEVLLTGQGGDDVFFQTPTPLIVADGFRHGLPLPELLGLARWQSRSAYGLWRAGVAAAVTGADLEVRRPAYVSDQAWGAAMAAPTHPWFLDLESAPPGKALQAAGLANALIVKAASQRGSRAKLRHPLLAQPVVEYCLGLSTPDLTRGRDRGLARLAFADCVPAEIIRRTTKGRMSAHYGRELAATLGEIRPLLLDGELAAAGVLNLTVLDELLTRERLIWRAGYGAIINLLVVELWVGAWRRRLASAARFEQAPS